MRILAEVQEAEAAVSRSRDAVAGVLRVTAPRGFSHGRLVRVLPDYAIPAAPLHAVYANAQHLAPRVRRFVDFCAAKLKDDWRWGD